MTKKIYDIDKIFESARHENPSYTIDDARELIENKHMAAASTKQPFVKLKRGFTPMNLITTAAALAATGLLTVNMFYLDTNKAGDTRGVEPKSRIHQPVSNLAFAAKFNSTDTSASYHQQESSIIPEKPSKIDVKGVQIIELKEHELKEIGLEPEPDGTIRFTAFGDTKHPVLLTLGKNGIQTTIGNENISKYAKLTPRFITDAYGNRKVSLFSEKDFGSMISSYFSNNDNDEDETQLENSTMVFLGHDSDTGSIKSKSALKNKKIKIITSKLNSVPGTLDSLCFDKFAVLDCTDDIDNFETDVSLLKHKIITKVKTVSDSGKTEENEVTIELDTLLPDLENYIDKRIDKQLNEKMKEIKILLGNKDKELKLRLRSHGLFDSVDVPGLKDNKNRKMKRYYKLKQQNFPFSDSLLNKRFFGDSAMKHYFKGYQLYLNNCDSLIQKQIIHPNSSLRSYFLNDSLLKQYKLRDSSVNKLLFSADSLSGAYLRADSIAKMCLKDFDKNNYFNNKFDDALGKYRKLAEQSEEFEKNINNLIRINKLVPVEVKLSQGKTEYLLWFDPSPELIAKLPESIRKKLEQENKLSSNTNGFCNEAITGEETYFDLWRACSGSIENMKVYPNPTKGKIRVEYLLKEQRTVTIAVHDLFGRKISELASNVIRQPGTIEESFSLNNIKPGMYLVSVQTDKNEKTIQRIIVQ